jgi:hypothetical protein
MVRLAYSLALAAAGVLSNTHAFAFIPSQPSRGLSNRHDIHSAFARPSWTPGTVQRSQRGQSFSPRYAAATLVPVEKSKALKVEFEKKFAEAQRAPQVSKKRHTQIGRGAAITPQHPSSCGTRLQGCARCHQGVHKIDQML